MFPNKFTELMAELFGPKIQKPIQTDHTQFKFTNRLLHLAIIDPEEYTDAVSWHTTGAAVLLHLGCMYARYDLFTLGSTDIRLDACKTPYLSSIVDNFTKHHATASASPLDITIRSNVVDDRIQNIFVDYHVAKQHLSQHVLSGNCMVCSDEGFNRLEQMLMAYAGGIIPPHITNACDCGNQKISSIAYEIDRINDGCRQKSNTVFTYS